MPRASHVFIFSYRFYVLNSPVFLLVYTLRISCSVLRMFSRQGKLICGLIARFI